MTKDPSRDAHVLLIIPEIHEPIVTTRYKSVLDETQSQECHKDMLIAIILDLACLELLLLELICDKSYTEVLFVLLDILQVATAHVCDRLWDSKLTDLVL